MWGVWGVVGGMLVVTGWKFGRTVCTTGPVIGSEDAGCVIFLAKFELGSVIGEGGATTMP